MKEQLYRMKHPEASFTRVKYDVVNQLGSRKVAGDVAKYIAVTHHKHRHSHGEPYLKAASCDSTDSVGCLNDPD